MNEQINNTLFFPMLISGFGTAVPMTKEENVAVWATYMTLSQTKRNQITASELPRKIKELQDAFYLSETAIGNVSLFIRKIFFGELTLQECEAKIGSMLTTTNGGDPNQARAIVEFIQKEILTIQPKPRVEESEETEEDTAEEEERMTVSLPILQALSKYENLGNQLITQERIKIKTQGESVRPSLLYWLKYYRDELGIGQHNSVERGDFLFRSENGKHLSSEERERVNLILKSIEENFPLTIDTKRQEIVFPASNAFSVTSAGRSSQTTEQNIAGKPAFQGVSVPPIQSSLGRESRQEASGMPTVAIPSVHLAPNQRQTFFHSIDQTETPRTTIQTNIPPEIGNDSHNNSGGMSFSSSHMFPAEKDETEQKPQSAPHLFNPFTIHPVSREEDEK